MSITIKLAYDCAQSCEGHLAAAGKDARTAWLLPDYARTLERKKALARSTSSLQFGCTVSTLNAWVEDLWSLYGNGRNLVTPVQRKLIMQQVLTPGARFGEVTFPTSPGVIDLLARMVEQGMGLDRFVELIKGSVPPTEHDLSPTEVGMIEVARAYCAELERFNLCEQSEAMRALASCEHIAWPRIACEGFSNLRLHEAAFFAALGNKTEVLFTTHTVAGSRFDTAQALDQALAQAGALLVRANDAAHAGISPDPASGKQAELDALRAALYYPNPDAPVVASGAVSALLPAGRYAHAALLADEVLTCAGKVLIACNHPASLFEELLPRLGAHAVPVTASYARPFPETDFGSAFLNALDIAESAQPDTFQASDFAFSVFGGISLGKAYESDARWRGNRLTNRSDIMEQLRNLNEEAAQFVDHLAAGQYTDALDLAEERIRVSFGEGEAFRAEQLSAVKCVRSLIEQADSLGRNARETFDLLLKAQVRTQVHAHPGLAEDAPPAQQAACPGLSVTIASYRDAQTFAANSFDTLFACDLNASEQSLRMRRTSVDELFDHLGYAQIDNALFSARLRMAQLLASASQRLVLVRTLHNSKAEPTYPAVVYEDIVDCYRKRITNEDGSTGIEGLDKTSALTTGLERFARYAGEEALEANLYPGAIAKTTIDQGTADEISAQALDLLCQPLKESKDSPLQMSPSAIEEYLDCPHKWFATRRMRLNEADASFSAREKGTLIHEVLHDYYLRLQCELGTTKPDFAHLPQAEHILEEEFERVLAGQKDKSLRDNPYIPLTQAEHEQTAAVLAGLKGFIARDAQLATDFTPKHFELKFGFDEPFEYAGVSLCGSIDRIDVDGKGRAIIVDYKSSLGKHYHLLAETEEGASFELPPKVQTLIYAQVARKLLGVKPVGALYLHTQRSNSQPQLCGAYDDHLFSPEDLLGVNAKNNALSQSSFGSFEELLDEVEDRIAEHLASLVEGNIAVSPRSSKVCEWCPVISCEGRN